MRGSRADYTRVPLPRAILLLALPMMLELVMESTFGLVDIYFVGKLGSEAVATVGLTGSVIILVFAVAMGLCMGTTAMVSRRIGEGDPAAAGVAAWQAIVVGVAVSIPIGIFGYFSAPKMLRLMGGSEPIVAGYGYTAVLFAGSATIFLLFLNNAIFRGAGDAAVAMRVLWFANIVNMILDPLLIFGIGPFPELGLTGAAVATTIGRGLGVGYQLRILFRARERIAITRETLHWAPDVTRRLLRVSATAMMQFLVGTAAWLGVTRIVALFGDTTLAGYTITPAAHSFRHPAFLGNQQRRRHAGRPEPGREKTRPRRKSRLHHRFVNFALLAVIAVVFWAFAVAADRRLHQRAGRLRRRRQKSENHQRRVCLLRLRDGFLAGFQRLGRHRYADAAQFLLLLVLATAPRLLPLQDAGHRGRRRVLRGHRLRRDVGARRLAALPAGQMEDPRDLTPGAAYFLFTQIGEDQAISSFAWIARR